MSLRLRLLARGRGDRHRRARRGRLRHLLGAALVPLQPGRPGAGPAPAPLQRQPVDGQRHCPSPGHGGVGGAGRRPGTSGGADPARAPATGRRRLPQRLRHQLHRGRSTQTGAVVNGLECPAYVGDHPYRPQLPVADHRLHDPARRRRRSRTSPPGPSPPGGPAFRVRAEQVSAGQRRRARAGAAARRPDQHAAHPLPDRAGRDRRRAGARAGRRLVAGPARPAPARGRRAHGRLHRRRQPRPAGARAPSSRPRSAAWPGRST